MIKIEKAIIIIIVCLFISCKEKRSYKQQFEEKIDLYIAQCMPPFLEKGVDSLTAESVCRCIMNTMFEIDSTFFLKSIIELDEILKENGSDLFKECEPDIERYFQKDTIDPLKEKVDSIFE